MTHRTGVPSVRSRWKGYLLLGAAALTCPCHLPILILLLGGTALAGALQGHFALVFLVLMIVFSLALFAGLKALEKTGAASATNPRALDGVADTREAETTLQETPRGRRNRS